MFDLEGPDDVAEAFELARFWESWEVTGRPAEQAEEIMGEWLEWRAQMILEEAADVVFACESFQLRPGAKSGNVLAGVYIMGAFDLVARDKGFEIEYQTAGQMKGYATNNRLKRWGLWVPGRDHRRDALGHLALQVNKRLR